MAEAEKTIRRDSEQTRRQIIDAAEDLFARHGIDQVTLLEIGRAAGQKNRNALQYHFGDKKGVINAVLDRHTEQIARQRELMLDALEGREDIRLRDLVDILVQPLAQHVSRHKNSRAFLLINCQMLMSSTYIELGPNRAEHMPSAQRLQEHFSNLMTATDPTILGSRLLLVQSLLFHGLASYSASKHQQAYDTFIEELCRGITGILAGDSHNETAS